MQFIKVTAKFVIVCGAAIAAPRASADALGVGCAFAAQAEAARARGPAAEAGIRPPAAATILSAAYPIAVHRETAVTEAYAREILGYAEAAWRVLFVEKGFFTPHPDRDAGGDARFDVYIVTTLPAGVGGYTGFSGYEDTTPRADAIGYVVVADAIDARIRRFVVAHELFHASQMAYDWWEDLAFMEGSATWIVDHVFDDEDIYWRYFPYFNREPFKALDFISMMNPYQYGSGLFSLFLDERYGRGDALFLRSLWERTVQDNETNEPDFLDATAALVAEAGGLDQALRDFGVWRLLVGSRKAYGKFSEVDLWDATMDPYLEVDMPPGVIAATGVAVKTVHPLAYGYLRFPRPRGERAAYSLTLGTEGPTRLAVDWVAISGRGATVTSGGIVGADQEQTFDVPSDATLQEMIFVVTNLSTPDHDTDTSPWLGRRFRYRFEATPE